jgi:protein FRA10AC1
MSNPPKAMKNVVCSADHEALEEGYTFVPSVNKKPSSWQERMVRRYHEGLYKEFALADLSRPGKLGLRWRTQKEVVDGRGETSCGNKRCQNASDLITLEIPFSYHEEGISKKELVKLRLCPLCRPLVDNKSKSNERGCDSDKAERNSERNRESADSESETSEDSDRSRKKRKIKKQKRSRHSHKKSRRSNR